jgi:hypothetical protein
MDYTATTEGVLVSVEASRMNHDQEEQHLDSIEPRHDYEQVIKLARKSFEDTDKMLEEALEKALKLSSEG